MIVMVIGPIIVMLMLVVMLLPSRRIGMRTVKAAWIVIVIIGPVISVLSVAPEKGLFLVIPDVPQLIKNPVRRSHVKIHVGFHDLFAVAVL